MSDATRDATIRRLYRERPTSPFLRISVLVVVLMVAGSWWIGEFDAAELVSERRMANLERFLGELVPYPLQGRPYDLGVATRWAADLLDDRGLEAAGTTLALSVAAIVLAGFGALCTAPFAARTVATPEPFVPDPRPPTRGRRAA
ncbi:MAG: hypothetical protein AAGE94_20685, partial [Acidobacteriota bacterium]